MDLRQWTEHCAYCLYEHRVSKNIPTDPNHDWRWAESLAQNNSAHIAKISSWDKISEKIMWDSFDHHLRTSGYYSRNRNEDRQSKPGTDYDDGIRVPTVGSKAEQERALKLILRS